MSPTVHIDRNPSVAVTDEVVEARPPDRIAFEAEGVIRPSESLLARFEGSSLRPVRVELSLGEGETVPVDLAEPGALRLESVDVGVATPDADGVRRGIDTIRSSGGIGDGDGGGDESGGRGAADAPTGAIAFTVEGTVRDLPPETVESVVGESPTLASVTFSVAESARADGGSPSDVLLEVGLLGYGVVVRRDGTVEVTRGGIAPALDLDIS